MPRYSFLYKLVLPSLIALPAYAGLTDAFAPPLAFTEPSDLAPPSRGDLESFFEFHIDPGARDFGSSKAPDESPRRLGVECGVLHDTAPVAQWIARPPPK